MSAFWSAALIRRSVDTRRSSRAFIAPFRAVLISSRSTAMASRKLAPESGLADRTPAAHSRLRPSMREKQPAAAPSVHDAAKASWAELKASALLVLADGSVFEGLGFRATGHAVGVVCFNTAMTGYEQILTDPSYAGQLITFTFLHVVIVGTDAADTETVNIPASTG